MYTGPNMAQPAGSTVAKTTLPVIAAICCAATLLLLLAATIVLALIPIYIPQKTLTKASTTSNQVSTYIPLTDSSRKRQTSSSISNFAGATIDDSDTLISLKVKFLVILVKSKKVKDITTLTCDIVLISSGRRRRLAISKRQGSGLTSLRCKYYILFLDTITSVAAQNSAGDSIRSLFQSDSSVFSLFVFDNLIITYNGVKRGFKCRANGFAILSAIRGGQFGLLDDRATIAPSGATSAPQVTGASG